MSDKAKKRAIQERVDAIRGKSSPVQNHYIDEYSAGKISRRDFIRRSTLIGMSIPVAGFLAAACDSSDDATTTTGGGAATTTTAAAATTTTEGELMEPVTVRVAVPAPTVGLDPALINDEGGLSQLGQIGQYPFFSNDELELVPVLADSVTPNEDNTVWMLSIAADATYNDGSPVTADDVVASVQGIADGNAGSAFETYGVDPGAVTAVDDKTVEFTLAAPNGAFPYFISSDNYNLAILPTAFWDTYEAGTEALDVGSGAWIVESYEPGVSGVFVKNPNYWGNNANQADRMEVTYFANEAEAVTAFQDGRLDVIPHISYSGGLALINDPSAKTQSISTAQHRQVYMDASAPPFDDVRVRQAMALMLNRPVLVEGLLGGFGVLGNDHPLWEFFPMYEAGTPAQRAEDLDQAAALLADAGYADGFDAPLDTLEFFEVPDLAQLIQTSAAQLGVNFTVNVTDGDTYYQDYWCSFPYEGPCAPGAQSSMGIVNYGHRGVPNVYMAAPLLAEGIWNASHYQSAEYDALFETFSTAPDLDTQRTAAGQIQTLLNTEVPFIVPYFVDHISITTPDFEGLQVTGMGHYSIVDAGFAG